MSKCHSDYKGVTYNYDGTNHWQAQIYDTTVSPSRLRYLGRHATERQAALAYNDAALELFGEHATLNDLPSTIPFPVQIDSDGDRDHGSDGQKIVTIDVGNVTIEMPFDMREHVKISIH